MEPDPRAMLRGHRALCGLCRPQAAQLPASCAPCHIAALFSPVLHLLPAGTLGSSLFARGERWAQAGSGRGHPSLHRQKRH